MMFTSKVKIASILLSILFIIAGLLGCKGNQAANDAAEQEQLASQIVTQTTSKSTSTKSTSVTKSTSKTTTTTKKAVPKLTDISFTLTPSKDQDIVEYTTPIYIVANQTLRLNWLIVKGGEYFYMTFTKPDGKFIAIRTDGGLSSYTPGEESDKLTTSGCVVFHPADNNWGDGYYIFHSQIHQDDTPVTIKLLYYVE